MARTHTEKDLEYEARREGKEDDTDVKRALHELNKVEKDATKGLQVGESRGKEPLDLDAEAKNTGYKGPGYEGHQTPTGDMSRAYQPPTTILGDIDQLPDQPLYPPGSVVLGDIDQLAANQQVLPDGSPAPYYTPLGGKGGPGAAPGSVGDMNSEKATRSGPPAWDTLSPQDQQTGIQMARGMQWNDETKKWGTAEPPPGSAEAYTGPQWGEMSPENQQLGYQMAAGMNPESMPRVPDPDPAYAPQGVNPDGSPAVSYYPAYVTPGERRMAPPPQAPPPQKSWIARATSGFARNLTGRPEDTSDRREAEARANWAIRR